MSITPGTIWTRRNDDGVTHLLILTPAAPAAPTADDTTLHRVLLTEGESSRHVTMSEGEIVGGGFRLTPAVLPDDALSAPSPSDDLSMAVACRVSPFLWAEDGQPGSIRAHEQERSLAVAREHVRAVMAELGLTDDA